MSLTNDTSRKPLKPLKIAIVGGSLTGLMCGVALKHGGHDVTIFERDADQRQSHMAGVCLGEDATTFLARHDRHDTAFAHRSHRIQQLCNDSTIKVFGNSKREITNWDTYYFRLRSCFDGYISSFYPSTPPIIPGGKSDGRAIYESFKTVLDIKRLTHDSREDTMLLVVKDRNTDIVSEIEADLIIGADGPDSFVRSKYAPEVKRNYCGYIAWRGTVLESEVSDETRHIFRRSVTVHKMQQHHCIVYTIPGENGSLKPGERLLNFLWYTNESGDSVDNIMVDGIDGHRHHNTVPAGRVKKEIWDSQLGRAKECFPAPFLEVILKIQQPFIQIITDFCSSQAAFEDGKVLLIGDALALLRPHTAWSGTHAAFHVLMVEDYVNGRITLSDWEEKVLRYSCLHWSQTIWWGKAYQDGMSPAFVSALYYWGWCGVDFIKSWWNGQPSLLRTTKWTVDKYDDED